MMGGRRRRGGTVVVGDNRDKFLSCGWYLLGDFNFTFARGRSVDVASIICDPNTFAFVYAICCRTQSYRDILTRLESFLGLGRLPFKSSLGLDSFKLLFLAPLLSQPVFDPVLFSKLPLSQS